MRSRCCLCVCVSALLLLGNNSVKISLSLLGSGSVEIPLSLLSNDSVKKNPFTVARRRLGRNFTAVTSTHATTEELLDASFSMWLVSYQGK
jgi:hypothetical protein